MVDANGTGPLMEPVAQNGSSKKRRVAKCGVSRLTTAGVAYFYDCK